MAAITKRRNLSIHSPKLENVRHSSSMKICTRKDFHTSSAPNQRFHGVFTTTRTDSPNRKSPNHSGNVQKPLSACSVEKSSETSQKEAIERCNQAITEGRDGGSQERRRFEIPQGERDQSRRMKSTSFRTRIASDSIPRQIKGGCREKQELQSDPPLQPGNQTRSLRSRGLPPTNLVEKKEICDISITLSREEIEEDYFAMTGKRPPRRTKKHPRTVQKQLDVKFPGLLLSQITTDSYKIPDFPEPRKRRTDPSVKFRRLHACKLERKFGDDSTAYFSSYNQD